MTSKLSLTIPNVGVFPLSMLDGFASLLWPIVRDGLVAGKGPEQIMTELKAAAIPDALNFAETALNIVFPGSGTVLEAVAWLAENSQGEGAVKTISGYGPDGGVIEIPNPTYKGD